ncbi:MAG: transaldolase [Caldilineaceae bacterium]|nr:transaldolase [Caldilineaceae bacterium]
MKTVNRLRRIQDFGQSIWLDYIRRDLFEGELQRMIEEDGLRGITSNPAIFEEAIAKSDHYAESIRQPRRSHSVEDLYWELAIEDIQRAADLFRPLYDELNGQDGFVSLEVSPHVARDTSATIRDAHRLWKQVDRPNIFIKVPASEEGISAIQKLIEDGINVNVTLLFSLSRYEKVAHAYMSGLEARLERGLPVDRVTSVASFFLSRIDVLVDEKLEEIMEANNAQSDIAQELYGEVAIANAKMAYHLYQEMTRSQRWQKLAQEGANPQRLLWASTSTKNPNFSEVRYVEALIGPETVNTLPMSTLEAYRNQGEPALRLTNDLPQARRTLEQLAELGIDSEEIAHQLEVEGLQKFAKPFDSLLDTLGQQVADAGVRMRN